MQEKLEGILKKINFNENLYGVFENATLENIVYIKNESIYKFEIKMDYFIDLRVYLAFLEACHKMNISARIKFIGAKASKEIVKEYFSYFLKQEYGEKVLLDSFLKLPFEIIDNTINVTCNASALFDTLEFYKNKIVFDMKDIGLNYDLKVIDITNNDSFTQLIESDSIKASQSNQTTTFTNNQNVKFVKNENKSFDNFGAYKKVAIGDIDNEDSRIEVIGVIFDNEEKESRNGTKSYSIYITDYKNSICIKTRESKIFSSDFLSSLQKGKKIAVRGNMEFNQYYSDYFLRPSSIMVLEPDKPRMDNAEEKRVELHLHTKMSQMDAVTSPEDYIANAIKWGHKAIAITDHGVVQAFPDAQHFAEKKDIKIIYGMEGYVVHNKQVCAINEQHIELKNANYVVFDLETTGLSSRYDKIIELGFVKYRNGVIVDTLQSFINPLMKLDEKIVELTHITDDMLLGAPTIDQMLPRLKEFIGDSILVAHNGVFDVGFLNAALKEYEGKELTNAIIDTLPLAHCIYPKMKKFKVGDLCKYLGVDYGSEDAHRADYDAKVLGLCFESMLHELGNLNITYHDEINSLSNPKEAFKYERPFHMTFLVKNSVGLKNLYKMVSMSHIEYINQLPNIPKDRIAEFREGLLIGSACFNGEIYEIAATKSEKELDEAIKFYDYIEIQPLDNYQWLIDTKRVLNKERLIEILNGIVKAAKKANKIVVATGDCHYLNPEDKIFRDLYIVNEAVGARQHPLLDRRYGAIESPIQHFRTTQEMIDGVSYLNDYELQKEVVVTNTNLIADMIEKDVFPVKPGTYPRKPSDVDANQVIRDLCYKRSHELYGEKLPTIVEERMEKELNTIIGNDYGPIYYYAYRLVKKSNEDGYLVGSRGSVGSSFVASLCGITEVNPLAPHYLCPKCHHSEFFLDGSVRSGFDLEDKICPECGAIMSGNGQNIPFETFLGLNGDKCPDIDLNFSRDYQASAHEYTKVLCGEKNVFRAGTVGTVASKTAFGYARKYYEAHNITNFREADLRRLSIGCMDVKRTTGQHPAGIVLVPDEYDIYDFCPIQYPADDTSSRWKTTHYGFNSMHDVLLKLDILGHLDPMAIRMLKDLTGVNPETIPMNDKEVMSLFTSLSSINCKAEDVLNTIASSGIPEFGTTFVKGVLMEAKPVKFSDLVQISGLTHGTDVWNDNAQELIRNNTCTLTDVIGCRDDIMTDLTRFGLEKIDAFKIMEFVRKGKPSKEIAKWNEYVELLKSKNVPEWYIESCHKIKYMFPKAHAVAYVVMALRVAWFKVHRPLEYYAAYFSVRCDKFDIHTMMQSREVIAQKVKELRLQVQTDKNVSVTVEDLLETMELVLECVARGYKIGNIDLMKSDAVNFKVDHDHNMLIPPFIVLDGLGDAAAKSVISAREQGPFTSKDDLIARTQLTKTNLQVLDKLGCLQGLNDKNQLTLDLGFDD